METCKMVAAACWKPVRFTTKLSVRREA